MKGQTTASAGTVSADWTLIEKKIPLRVNAALFSKGVFVITDGSTTSVPSDVSTHSFKIGKKTLVFSTRYVQERKENASLMEAAKFFCDRLFPSDKQDHLPIIVNPDRTEEFYFPISIKSGSVSEDGVGSYVHTWRSSETNNFAFSGFEQYVTAGCIFGSSLKGEDEQGFSIPLIKHDLKVHSRTGQKIQKVFCEPNSPYDMVQFREVERTARMINFLAKQDGKKKLLYHLPSLDYAIFGIKLFLKDEITLDALKQLFPLIYERKTLHEKRITEICQKYGIEVEFTSPFDNIFSDLTIDNEENFSEMMLNIFSRFLSEAPSPNEKTDKKSKKPEKDFVKFCLSKLLDGNSGNLLQRKVWSEHIKASELLNSSAKEQRDHKIEGEHVDSSRNNLRMDTVEDLLRTANTIIVAQAACEHGNDKTCSILPVSEKQIQVQYRINMSQCNKALSISDKKTHYPSVVNITFLDSVITYLGTRVNPHSGLLFYASSMLDTLQKFFKSFDVARAWSNISQIAQGNEPIPLGTAFSSHNIELKKPANTGTELEPPNTPSSVAGPS